MVTLHTNSLNTHMCTTWRSFKLFPTFAHCFDLKLGHILSNGITLVCRFNCASPRMLTYKSPGSALNHSEDNASSRQPDSEAYIPFLKLATLSFAIPPPISVSVRSRQAGTETEREPSAMEALGPGKRMKQIARVGSVYAQMHCFTGGRGCNLLGLDDTEKQTIISGPSPFDTLIQLRHYCVRNCSV